MSRRCAERNLFSQETLATIMCGFAKLDFNHPKLCKAFETAAEQRLDKALAMGPDYRRSGGFRQADVFDLQALVLILHTLVCLVGTREQVVEKLLTLISWSKDEVSDWQRRLLKITITVVEHDYPAVLQRAKLDVKEAIHSFRLKPAKVPTRLSRWTGEMRRVLRKMGIDAEPKPLVDDQVLDLWIPASKAAVVTVGPHGYYTKTTDRTAYSKLHQRLLEIQGYTCITIPYYEWAELRLEEDKMVYLWSLGRKAVTRGQKPEPSEAAAILKLPDDSLLSDLSDLGEARL